MRTFGQGGQVMKCASVNTRNGIGKNFSKHLFLSAIRTSPMLIAQKISVADANADVTECRCNFWSPFFMSHDLPGINFRVLVTAILFIFDS